MGDRPGTAARGRDARQGHPAFTGDAGKRQAWRAFLSRITQEELGLEGLADMPPGAAACSSAEAVETVWAFLGPVVRGEAGGSRDPQGQRWEEEK